MSLINVFLSSSKALIGVDTEGSDPKTGQFITISKMVHLPHANVVMAGRGTQGFLMLLFLMVIETDARAQSEGDFDSLVKSMPEIFANTYKLIDANRPHGVDSTILDDQQIVLAGWSNLLNRMHAICCTKRGPGGEIEMVEIEEPGYIMPWDDNWGEAPEGDDHRAMMALALAQTRHVKQESPGTAMGGRLLVAELTRHSMSFSSACDLPSTQGPVVGDLKFSAADLRAFEAGTADADLLARRQRAKELWAAGDRTVARP
jgi:hypothetical protein